METSRFHCHRSEIEDFVKTHLCNLREILRSRVLRVFYVTYEWYAELCQRGAGITGEKRKKKERPHEAVDLSLIHI